MKTLILQFVLIGALALGFAGCCCSNKSSTASAPATAAARPAEVPWKFLFDGKSLQNWKRADFGSPDEIKIENGLMLIPAGSTLSGATYTGDDVPGANYEIDLEAQKVQGSDFFCGLTFPVNKAHASLILGGWGGSTCGISSIDDNDASSNDTTKYLRFDDGRWYHVRVKVYPNRLQAWVDDEQIVDADITNKKVDIRPDISESAPFGIATYQTKAAIKYVKIRPLQK